MTQMIEREASVLESRLPGNWPATPLAGPGRERLPGAQDDVQQRKHFPQASWVESLLTMASGKGVGN